MAADVEKLKKVLTAKPHKPAKDKGRPRGLSTGSTLLNLACTGDPDVGFPLGLYFQLVGDSSAGKTFFALTCLAEAAVNKEFDGYRFVFDNAENGALMDLARFFGAGMARRLEPPAGTRADPRYSETVEGFFATVDRWFARGEPFVYVLDSTDCLTTLADQKKGKKAAEGDEAGSYGTARAKVFSEKLRLMNNALRQDGHSIVILVSQTRQRVGFGAQFDPKTHSGGLGLKFYAALQIWFSVKGHIKRTVLGKSRELGIVSHARVRKNRLTGRDRAVDVPIYHAHGIDDLESCVDFLVAEGHWSEERGRVNAPEFDFAGSKEKLIQKLADGGGADLRRLAAARWNDIETACAPERRPRYA